MEIEASDDIVISFMLKLPLILMEKRTDNKLLYYNAYLAMFKKYKDIDFIFDIYTQCIDILLKSDITDFERID